MRERTTWNRQEIAGRSEKTAGDPMMMDKGYMEDQPSDDEYLTGGPSEFAEDVHPYESEETERDEIGLPEFQESTHMAAHEEETLVKKAEVCVKVARSLLGNVDEAVIEDQALAFMSLSDKDLIDTALRLAKEEEEAEEAEEKEEEEAEEAEEKEEEKAEEAEEKEEEKAEEAEEKEEEKAEEKKASQEAMYTAEQVEVMIQEAMAKQHSCQGEDHMEDAMIDEMLQEPMEGDPEADIELEGIPMDIGEVEMAEGDQVLSELFATNVEVQQARAAHSIETGIPVRTASTRTVGTRPTAGVSQIGGAASPSGPSEETDKLSNLWRSAPDVSDVFK